MGSTALVYYKSQVDKMDPLNGELSLPGWDSSYSKQDLDNLFEKYSKIDTEDLWTNLEYFLKEIIPVAEASGVKMAIHPDDPPWPIFGLPRIIIKEENLDRFLKLVDNKYNGLTVCTGSLIRGYNMSLPFKIDLSDKVVVITGGTGVLGSYWVDALAESGAKVAILGRDMEKINKKVEEVKDNQGVAAGFVADILDKGSLKLAHNKILESLVRVKY